MMTLTASALLTVATMACVTSVSAQSRQEQAARVIEQAGGPSTACALLTDDEIVKISGRRSYSKPEGTKLTNGGSACDYSGANVTLFSGPKSDESYEALLKNFKKDQTPRVPVAGIGDRAYFMAPKPRDEYEGRYQMLVVKKGAHTFAIALEAQKNESTESLQPKVMALAKMALARLP
jgi:hypothetical protein